MAILHSSDKFEIMRLYLLYGFVRKVAIIMSLNRKIVTDALVSMGVKIIQKKGDASMKLNEWQQKAVVRKFKNKVFTKSTEGVDYIFSSFKIRVSDTYVRSLLKKIC